MTLADKVEALNTELGLTFTAVSKQAVEAIAAILGMAEAIKGKPLIEQVNTCYAAAFSTARDITAHAGPTVSDPSTVCAVVAAQKEKPPSLACGTYLIKTTFHAAGKQPANWGLACFPSHGGKRNDESSWVHVHSGDHWPCRWEVQAGQKPGTYRLYTCGHSAGGQRAGWGLSAWHAHGAERNGVSSWVAVHSGDHWPMDWQIVVGQKPNTWRLLTTEHEAGMQAAGWGLSAWNAHGAKRNDGSSRVAVHAGDHNDWPMDWVFERI